MTIRAWLAFGAPVALATGSAHFQAAAAQAQDHAILQVDRWLRAWVDLQTKKRRTAQSAPQRVIQGMQGYWRHWAGAIRHSRSTAKVIEMSMRKPDIGDPPTALFSLSQDQMTIPGGVDHCCIPCFGISNEIRVCLRGT